MMSPSGHLVRSHRITPAAATTAACRPGPASASGSPRTRPHHPTARTATAAAQRRRMPETTPAHTHDVPSACPDRSPSALDQHVEPAADQAAVIPSAISFSSSRNAAVARTTAAARLAHLGCRRAWRAL